MKPAPFDYFRPASIGEACAFLAANPEARVLAGGQTLIPMLSMRLARPSALVDVTRMRELKGIDLAGYTLRIGAATTQAEALDSALVAREAPLLRLALSNVGHPPTRVRGTIGGSIAHADPSAEIALAATILGASIVYRDGDEEIRFEPVDFFIGPTITTAPPSGLLTHVAFPRRPKGRVGAGFREIAARRGDYAVASAGAQVVLRDDGTCASIALGVGGVGDVPVNVDLSELDGTPFASDHVAGVVAAALADLECVGDLHATASYRRRAAIRLAMQAIGDAHQAAMEDAA
ncbi:FAD binding domain-containing protein [Aquibium sp. LZ166]|uniref:FAD binding domain-containing protein n=1 Tax=Aquibium pacificus TaxID=3153579 RepID=A0ABV3SNG6_9HYPH